MIYSLAVPIAGETDAKRLTKKYYRLIGVKPEYIYDAKFLNGAKSLSKLWRRTFSNPGKILETSYEEFAKQAEKDWVFRVDADEVPNLKAIDYLNTLKPISKNSVIGIQRFQIIKTSDKFFFLESEEFEPKQHIQWRFFNRSGAKWLGVIHTPGIVVKPEQEIQAPEDACLYHLEFLFLSKTELHKKSQRYDSIGQNSFFHKYQRDIVISQLRPIEDLVLLNFLEKNKDEFLEWQD